MPDGTYFVNTPRTSRQGTPHIARQLINVIDDEITAFGESIPYLDPNAIPQTGRPSIGTDGTYIVPVSQSTQLW